MNKPSMFGIALAAGMLTGVQAQAAPIEIQFWHAMGGANGDRVNQIADNFNRVQDTYKIAPVFKGSYAETMTAGIAAFRAGKAPHILMVFEVGTGTMMAAKGAVIPVYKLMADTGVPFDPKAYNPAVTGYYSTADGKMLSMPFASSTVVMWYNKDAFKKAGLDPAKPPKTWPEVGEYGKKLVASGLPCGFSTSWFTWVMLENFSSWHNVPFGTKANGLGGMDAQYTFNGPLQVKHIAQLAEWQKDKTFVYTGRDAIGEPRFTSGDCGMFLGSSAGYGGIKAAAKFEFAAAEMPYYPDVQGAPQNSIIGGNSLWVMGGHSKEENMGVAQFFRFLSMPIIQSYWHAWTGYVPITQAAYEDMKSVKFYDAFPGRDIPIIELAKKAPTENSMGLRFGYLPQARDFMYEAVEDVFNGKKTAQQGLDDAVKRGNELLRKFEAENK